MGFAQRKASVATDGLQAAAEDCLAADSSPQGIVQNINNP